MLLKRENISKKLGLFSICMCSLSSTISVAGDVDFIPKIDATGYLYETRRGSDAEFVSNNAIVINPSLLSTYTSKGFVGSILAEHTNVTQKQDTEGADKSYNELQYSSLFTLIENAMYIGAKGSQKYRVVSQINQDFGDKILSPGELTKYRTNGVNFSFTNPSPKYIAFNFDSSYNKSKTEEATDSVVGLDSTTTTHRLDIFQGRKANGYTFNLSARQLNSEREDFNDFKSKNLNGRVSVSFLNDLSLVLLGSIDEYDIDISEDNNNLGRRSDLDSNSYGAGLEWSPRSGKLIRLTYNQIDEFSGSTKYVGLSTNWEFSSRTAMSFDLSKKFYGDAYNFTLSQNLRSFRLSASYSENVSSFATLGASTSPQLFVCTIGATDFSECFQPDSPTYELAAGEEFLNVNQLNTDISEEVFLAKSGNISLGYEKRKIKASLTVSYNRTEYLESERENTNRKLNLSINYKLGRRTNMGLNSSLSERETERTLTADNIISHSISFNRSLTQSLKLTVSAKFIDRNSEQASRDLTDRRLTAGLSYTF